MSCNATRFHPQTVVMLKRIRWFAGSVVERCREVETSRAMRASRSSNLNFICTDVHFKYDWKGSQLPHVQL
jgi:hypothetical protein